jgi:murein DD-endopeptidase / murein LD-carboxypeptidase
MRYAVICFLILIIACQSTVRYTSEGDLTDSPADNSEENSGDYSAGTVDSGRMNKIIAGYLRTPYKNGGVDKNGIDCSGLVMAVYNEYNSTRLPRNTGKLYSKLRNVEYKTIAYGDLVFFALNGSGVSHVGIYVGNKKFVHASKSRGVVIDSMNEDYYVNSFKGVRRVLW